MEPEDFREVENPGRCYEKAMRIEMRKGMGREVREGGVGEVGCRGRGGNWKKRERKGTETHRRINRRAPCNHVLNAESTFLELNW